MALAGFKIAVNYCIRPFQNIPIAIYTDIPFAHIKCMPEDTGIIIVQSEITNSAKLLVDLEKGLQKFYNQIGKSDLEFRFEIKDFTSHFISSDHLYISAFTAICTMLNEWLHHPLEKNDLLAWLIKENINQDADIISACMYGGIMSSVGTRPFRIYQPKGLYFHLEAIQEAESGLLPASLVPLFLLALERSDFNSIHELLNSVHPTGDMQESYLGILDLPNLQSRLHIHNVSTPDISSFKTSSKLSTIFSIDSNGSSVV